MSRRNSWNRVPYRTRQAIKSQLLARDGLRCCRCGLPIKSAKAATIEHLKPRGRGGSVTDLRNLGLAHANCNYSRRYDGGARVVDGSAFFSADTPDTPRPVFFPPPNPQKKHDPDHA